MFRWHQPQDRTLIYLHGEDWRDYIQGLITQDIDLIETQPLIYTHLLNAQGRYEGECFITRWGEGILIDFPTAVWKRLGAKLKLLKLRRDVSFEECSHIIALLSFEDGGGVPTGRAPQQARSATKAVHALHEACCAHASACALHSRAGQSACL